MVKDRRAHTYTATLGVRVRNFALLSDGEQERRLAAYGTVLAGLARDDSVIRRVGWVERTVPNDGDDVTAYLQQARDPGLALDSGPVASYIELIESAADVTQDHELFVSLQLDGWRARAQARKLGPGDEGMLRLIVRELDLFARRVEGAGVQVLGALPPRMLAKAIRDGYDPFGRTARARAGVLDPQRNGTPTELAGPQARQTTWSTLATDSAVHATYWISEWPRIDVGAVFLQPLLMQTTAVRTVAMVMDAIAPSRAITEIEQARTTDIADETTRQRLGQVTTARQTQKAEATARREQELADGHAELRYAAYVTVSARADEPEALDRACAEVEHAAQQSRLRLERLYGEQDYAFTSGCRCAEDSHDAARGASRRRGGRCRPRCPRVRARALPAQRPGIGSPARTCRPPTRSWPRAAWSRGVYIGRDLHGGSFVYDPWELYGRELTDPNMVLVGHVGSAKSSLVKTLIFRQHVFGGLARVIDVKREYAPLAMLWAAPSSSCAPAGR